MSDEKIFGQGVIFKLPADNAPDFVVGKISLKVDEVLEFISKHDNGGWVNLEVLKQKSDPSKAYTVLDTWKPEKKTKVTEAVPKTEIAGDDDDLPF